MIETRDSQNVQSATLSLPPRTIGVAGAAPANALAFINLIQQNTAAMMKSPGAQSPAPAAYAKPDRPAVQERDDSANQRDDSSDADATDAQAKSIYEASDSAAELAQPAMQETTDSRLAEDDTEEEEVIVGQVNVAAAGEEANQAKSSEGEATAAGESAQKLADASLSELTGDPSPDDSAAVDPDTDPTDAGADFAQQLADASAEESTAAADSELLAEVASTTDKQSTDADPELTVAPEETEPVQQTSAEQTEQAPAVQAESEKIRQAQAAAAAALEQEPVSEGLSAAEEFAQNRREATQRISKAIEGKQDGDAQIDPTANPDPASAPRSVTTSPPGMNAASAAAELAVAPISTTPAQTSMTSSVETPSVSAQPGLGSAIQRGLQRGLLQNATKSAGDVPPIDTAKQIQLIQRISQAVRTAEAQGGPIKLRLSPPELGSLRVEMQVDEGGMKAKLEVESEAVRKVLLDNLPQLRDRLAELNLRVDSFDVSVGQNGNPQDFGGAFADQQQNSTNQRRSSSDQRAATKSETQSPETTSAPVVSSDGQLNVMV